MATGCLLQFTNLDDEDAIALDYDYSPTTTAIALREDNQLNDVGGDLVKATSMAMRTLLSSFGECSVSIRPAEFVKILKLIYKGSEIDGSTCMHDFVTKFQSFPPF